MIRTFLRAIRIGGDIKAMGKGRYHRRIAGRAIRRPLNRKISRWFR